MPKIITRLKKQLCNWLAKPPILISKPYFEKLKSSLTPNGSTVSKIYCLACEWNIGQNLNIEVNPLYADSIIVTK